MSIDDRVIFAADMSNASALKTQIEQVKPFIRRVKIGLELISSVGGPQAIKIARSCGATVFYDGKFADTPRTTEAAIRALRPYGIHGLTVHASAGPRSVKAAVHAATDDRFLSRGYHIKIFGVTVLTSMDDLECVSVFSKCAAEKVLQFAGQLLEFGANGIVCSPLEAKMLRMHSEFNDLVIATPGIQQEWARATEDQSRTATAQKALDYGADQIIVGRTISHTPQGMSLRDAAERLLEDINQHTDASS